MLGKNLNLDGQSLVDVFIIRPTVEESEGVHKVVKDIIMDKYYPELVGYLEGQKFAEKAHACQSREELEKMELNTVPPDMFRKLAKILNGLKELTDTERAFMLAQFGERLIYAATKHVEVIMQQRLNVIMTQKKQPSRIIIP